jgi:hypothetical protein
MNDQWEQMKPQKEWEDWRGDTEVQVAITDKQIVRAWKWIRKLFGRK